MKDVKKCRLNHDVIAYKADKCPLCKVLEEKYTLECLRLLEMERLINLCKGLELKNVPKLLAKQPNQLYNIGKKIIENITTRRRSKDGKKLHS